MTKPNEVALLELESPGESRTSQNNQNAKALNLSCEPVPSETGETCNGDDAR